jgi:hypothetical protein
MEWTMSSLTTNSIKAIKRSYAGDEERPLGSFLGLMATYGAVVLAGTAVVRARNRPLPERPAAADLALIAVATHKVARLLAKDPVTAPFRAPFTQFEGQSGEAEVSEEVVGTGPRKAVGELLTCPFCLDQWVATGWVFALLLAPRATRFAAGGFTAVAAADALQFGYDALQSD